MLYRRLAVAFQLSLHYSSYSSANPIQYPIYSTTDLFSCGAMMVDLLYDIKLKIPLANDASPPSIHPVIVICPETTRLERPATPRFSDVTTQQKVYTLRPIQVQYVHFFASALLLARLINIGRERETQRFCLLSSAYSGFLVQFPLYFSICAHHLNCIPRNDGFLLFQWR